MIINIDNHHLGFIVDEVDPALDISKECILPHPIMEADTTNRYLTDIARLSGESEVIEVLVLCFDAIGILHENENHHLSQTLPELKPAKY